MEREVRSRIVRMSRTIPCAVENHRFTFSIRDRVRTFLCSVLHDRPVSRACRPEHWPDDLRPAVPPTPSTMTRRMRSEAFNAFMRRAHRRLRGRFSRGWIHLVDSKPLPIAGHGTDPDAGYGRGAGGKAKGYWPARERCTTCYVRVRVSYAAAGGRSVARLNATAEGA